MKRNWLVAFIAGFLAILLGGEVFAQPADDTATCAVSATVNDIMEWGGNFPAIDLGNIIARSTTLTGSADQTVYTNGNVDVTADNTATAELSLGGSTLVTEYGLSYDSDGTAATGGATVSYTLYSSFLSSASTITHVSGDGAVVVTLSARATNDSGNVADSGSYSATQTLTASWGTQ